MLTTRVFVTYAAMMGAIVANSPMSAADEAKRIVFLDGPVANRYIGALTRGFMDVAKPAGIDVKLLESPFDPALQAQQLDDAIAQKVDAVVMLIMSQKALLPALNRAKQAHIPVILINTPIAETELFTAFVGEDSNMLGVLPAQAMASALGASKRVPAKVAIIAGSMDEGVAPVRADAFKKEIEAKAPQITVVAVEETHWAPPEAERAAGQLLARFAGQGGLDGMYGMNDALADGIVQAAESAGSSLGRARVNSS